MKNVYWLENSIIIEEDKKTLFSTKKVTTEISLDDIEIVSRAEYEGELTALEFFLKNAHEEYVTSEEYQNLEGLYEFLVEQKRRGKAYKIQKFDVETTQIEEILV